MLGCNGAAAVDRLDAVHSREDAHMHAHRVEQTVPLLPKPNPGKPIPREREVERGVVHERSRPKGRTAAWKGQAASGRLPRPGRSPDSNRSRVIGGRKLARLSFEAPPAGVARLGDSQALLEGIGAAAGRPSEGSAGGAAAGRAAARARRKPSPLAIPALAWRAVRTARPLSHVSLSHFPCA
eukprot:354569-Chlamydomonas_euryale.AAC.2